jgi:uncharacterized membrane protein YbhN (UPF0104 family)
VSQTSEKIPFNHLHLYWALALSVLVSGYLIAKNFNAEALRQITWSSQLMIGLVLAAITVLFRDGAYIYRIRLLTKGKMTWRQSTELVLLWEYGTAATPATTGGMALALMAFHRQKISAGKSTAYILLAKFYDDLCFVVIFSLLYLWFGSSMLNVSGECADLSGQPIMQAVRTLGNKAWWGYALLLSLCVLMGTMIFVLPHKANLFLQRIASAKWLSRFELAIRKFGHDIELTAHEFKNASAVFHVKIFLTTAVSWMARYALAVTLIYAFSDVALNHLEVYARQFLLWVFIMLPATPGASGVAEVSFMAMNCEYIPVGLSAAVALVWRMFSYYSYLVVGVFMLRRFLLRKPTN